jgi:hypothetical protein
MENAQFADTVSERIAHRTTPWNKGKLTGAKPPLQPKHVWAIRTRFQMAERTRDAASLWAGRHGYFAGPTAAASGRRSCTV